ncbi:Protein-glutamate methylesterase [Burkholderiales bacterium 8X]|nr:Protein-glutamate methylesterase [Burkholderiales bacterium 8X]
MTEPTPDHLEEELADQMDDAVPSRGYQMTPLVGLGGSAGAIGGLRTFFETVEPDTGLAFVVVIHLAAEQESKVAEVLQRCTDMPVVQVQETCKVEPNCVYVIPPGQAIKSANGYLRLQQIQPGPQSRMTVDLFFRALADTHGPHAAAVVLSGGNGDGAVGLKRIKERGGLTVAQDPAEAEHSTMPAAAIATGMVDWILPLKDIAARLREYFKIEKSLRLPSEQGPQPAVSSLAEGGEEAALRDVLTFLRARTGRDFSYYKRATIVRRIARRMQVNGVAELPAYLDCLRVRPGEAGALLQDLLISVTNFFRDSECFGALTAHIPVLFQGKSPNDSVRVWVAACATGEEAYSIAMLLIEHARTLDAPPTLQVFATDLDAESIQVARDGFYPDAIQADVSPERLSRFFTKEPGGYRVRREVREMVLFASHDLLRDSPFSRLDLVTCRNLLIYLDPEAQRRAFQIFNFGLLPQGLLFLGASESVEDGNPHFSAIDKKHRLYVQRSAPRVASVLASSLGNLPMPFNVPAALQEAPVVAGRGFLPAGSSGRPFPLGTPRGSSWSELHLRLLETLGPPSVLVDGEGDVVHISPSAGRYLQHAGGEPTRNLLRMIVPALRIELRAALHQAAQTDDPVAAGPVLVPIDDEHRTMTLRVVKLREASMELMLVTFETVHSAVADPVDPAASREESGGADPLVNQLDQELERLRMQLRDTVEQYEISTQELKASNEELQAINEELRSATEELETSREELQSINEELTTVNHELKAKVDELAHANADMQNLINATAIATVFLDRELRITRYTPASVRIFNFIPGDLGRPLSDLTPQLNYRELGEDAARVLERLAPIEREVGREDGGWFLARLLPYRTAEDRIAGVVISFIDITDRKHAEEVSQWLSAVVASSMDAIISFSLDGTILSWNGGAERTFGYKASDAVGQPIRMIELAAPHDQLDLVQAVIDGRSIEQLQAVHRGRNGDEIHVALSVSPIGDAHRRVVGGTATARDVGDARRAEQALRASEERLRLVIENARDYAIFSSDIGRRVTSWNPGAERLLGYTEAEVLGKSGDVIFTEEDRIAGAPQAEAEVAMTKERAADERFHVRKDGSRFWGSGVLMRMHDSTGGAVGFVKILRDETAARAAQAALEQSQAELLLALNQNEQARLELEAADVAKDRFIAVLSHELRNPLASVSSAAGLLTGADASPPERAHAAQIVQRQARTMKALVDDLLDVSRLAVGRLELNTAEVTLQSVIEVALETARPLLEDAKHHLSVRLPNVPVMLEIDSLRISQALVNLLTNAAKYTPPGGKLSLVAEVEGDEAVILVSDNGVGMAQETIERMFDLYTQGPATAHRNNEGLGVGLALVRNIVKLHGGQVDAWSDGPGHGSHFRVRLPLARAPEAPITLLPPADAVAGKQGALVLIADDNTDASWALGRLLQAAGHRVLSAADGIEALAVAQKEKPDFAILDIGMPGLSGLEVARSLRALPEHDELVLIALTGWGGGPSNSQSLQEDFDAHLTKPVELADLQRTMAEAEARRRQRGEV